MRSLGRCEVIVPEYWAEARLQERRGARQVTVRRFGWSDTGLAEAEMHAGARAREALERIFAGESLPRRERAQAYGEAGLPIREEILRREGDAVITRNAYGAHCLNTPDVLFADVDFAAPAATARAILGAWIVLVVAVTALAVAHSRWGLAIGGAVLALPIAAVVAYAGSAITLRLRGGAERVALRRVRAYGEAHREVCLRVYRTPAGLRVLAAHRTYDPAGDEAADLFRACGVDRLYATMCRQQRCFRARLTGKPWRMGVPGHMRPRPGVWPVQEALRPLREAWIRDYEARVPGFAACRYLETIGEGAVDAHVAAIVELHDRESGALSERPLA